MIKINISTKKRMRTSLFIVFLIIVILIGRLGYIQLIDGKKLSELAFEQQTLDRTINPKRGTIYDATGHVLAQSSTVETITVNPGNIDKNIKEKVAKKLSEIFELDYEKTLKKVSKRSSIETIAKKVEKDVFLCGSRFNVSIFTDSSINPLKTITVIRADTKVVLVKTGIFLTILWIITMGISERSPSKMAIKP